MLWVGQVHGISRGVRSKGATLGHGPRGCCRVSCVGTTYGVSLPMASIVESARTFRYAEISRIIRPRCEYT
ncbi:hypothetical protein TVNIR_2411 [Thioalkalivibrio nitratireducens DSM 14787]|uniref:Uncharacterized protein n=1 Tax=Thioalkalivibrio nitratireducens (strain DSM 14787 / UNIQEM 213 / ALEN2) TaxID=1255043 RepID=L0DYL6_THIND|nr:hypothetical protein TVNIR_2411 [Thioalkalivibrio nitratireducens DSM 14787]